MSRLQPVHLRLAKAAITLALLAALAMTWCADAMAAEDAWEYRPYQVRVWIGQNDWAGWTPAVTAALKKEIRQQAELSLGATWRSKVVTAPSTLRHDIASDVASITAEQIIELAPKTVDSNDKIFLVSLQGSAVGFEVAARELDCRTQVLGPIARRQFRQQRQIGVATYAVIEEAFHPFVRIENAKGITARTRLRAAGLIARKNSPADIKVGSVLKPVIRRNGRKGKLLINGIVVIDLTYLYVRERSDSLRTCRIYSSYANSVTGKSTKKTERLALAARPRLASTEIQLVARRTEPAQPLVGYYVYSKDPTMKEVPPPVPNDQGEIPPSANPPLLLGQTDWRGVYTVEKGKFPLRILYIKNGQSVLQRIPIVPGLTERVQAGVRSDDARLRAEVLIVGLQASLMDLVIRRELLKASIQQHLKENELAEAKQDLDELRSLPTANQLNSLLNDAPSKLPSITDSRVQESVNKMFLETRQLVKSYLSPGFVTALEKEVARKGKGVSE